VIQATLLVSVTHLVSSPTNRILVLFSLQDRIMVYHLVSQLSLAAKRQCLWLIFGLLNLSHTWVRHLYHSSERPTAVNLNVSTPAPSDADLKLDDEG